MLPMTPFSKGAGDRGEHWKVVPSSMQLNQSKMPAGLGLNVLCIGGLITEFRIQLLCSHIPIPQGTSLTVPQF